MVHVTESVRSMMLACPRAVVVVALERLASDA